MTYAAARIVPLNVTTVGFAYVLYVLVTAAGWGFLEAFAASILAAAFFNFFFLPPVGTLTISDPQNWAALAAFLATSLIGSRLSAVARKRTVEALRRQRDLERLYTFGRAILLIDDSGSFARQLVARLAETFELAAAALYERRSGEIYLAGPAELEEVETLLHQAAHHGTVFAEPERARAVTPVRLGSEPIASLAIQGEPLSESVLQSIANLVAIGLERAKAQELAHEVEAARRGERLRNTLIDAMAHELKTPLTSIRAATTALLSFRGGPPPNASRMLEIADEEAAHLEELIDNTLDAAQLDTGSIALQVEAASLGDTVAGLLRSAGTKTRGRTIEFAWDASLPAAPLDARLVNLALKQVLDNAVKYSPDDTPIRIRGVRTQNGIAVEITDHGAGIPAAEQKRIFDRFYRSPSVEEKIPGSGLGLSIAHRIALAHGGELSVESRPGETTFRFALPI